MRADDFAAKFLKVTEGGTYLHRECGRADYRLAFFILAPPDQSRGYPLSIADLTKAII
jgi:hypothetical protein